MEENEGLCKENNDLKYRLEVFKSEIVKFKNDKKLDQTRNKMI